MKPLFDESNAFYSTLFLEKAPYIRNNFFEIGFFRIYIIQPQITLVAVIQLFSKCSGALTLGKLSFMCLENSTQKYEYIPF